MSFNRQQRAGRDVRTVTTVQPQQVPQLAMYTVATSLNTINFSGRQLSQPPVSGAPDLVMQLAGLPAVYRVIDGTYPTAAVLQADGVQLKLTYPGATIADGELFLVGPYDPAVRTATGGWMVPGIVGTPAATPIRYTYTGVVQIDGSVLLGGNVVLAIGSVVMSPQGWKNVTGGGVGMTQVIYNAGTLLLVPPAPMTAGDVIRYDGPILGNGGTASDIDRGDVTTT